MEEGGANQGGHVAPRRSLSGRDEEDAAVQDGPSDIDGGAGLAEDGGSALGGGVVGEACLDGGDGLGPVLAAPAAEVPGSPFAGDRGRSGSPAHGSGTSRRRGGAARRGWCAARRGVRGRVRVGLVEAHDRVIEDGLHPLPASTAPTAPWRRGRRSRRCGL